MSALLRSRSNSPSNSLGRSNTSAFEYSHGAMTAYDGASTVSVHMLPSHALLPEVVQAIRLAVRLFGETVLGLPIAEHAHPSDDSTDGAAGEAGFVQTMRSIRGTLHDPALGVSGADAEAVATVRWVALTHTQCIGWNDVAS